MVTDSWSHARDLVGRFLARTGSGATVIADLDHARARLLTTAATEDEPDEQAISDITEAWRTHLQRLIGAGQVSGEDLRALLTSLHGLASASATRQVAVHNDISGGVQHGPVIQSGRITGLTLHVRHSQPPPSAEEGAR
jgi:hypothetical protein